MAALNAQLAALEEQYAAAVADKDAAVAQAEACQRKLDLANRLIAALASGEPWHGICWVRSEGLRCCMLQQASATWGTFMPCFF